MPWQLDTSSPIFKSMSPAQQQQIMQQYGGGTFQNAPLPIQQEGASLQQTQTGIQQTQAAIPGVQAQSQKEQIQAQQAAALQSLSKDLQNKMTLPQAMSKYKALGMNADDILNQYISESPWGFPDESPTELHNMGVSEKTIGQPGQAYTYADRQNTAQALNEINKLQNLWNSSSLGDRVKGEVGLSNPTRLYNQSKNIIGEHLSTLIPGAPGAQASADKLMSTLPDIGDLRINNNDANQLFENAKTMLMTEKGYRPQDLKIQNATSVKTNPGGGDLLKSLLTGAIPTVGAVAGGIGGGLLGGVLDIPTGVIPGATAGAIAGAGVGGAVGQGVVNKIEGQKFLQPNVATTGFLSGAGEGAGAAVGAIGGKIGSALADKIPANVFDKVVSASPSFSTDVTTLKNTASKYGLMNGSSADAVQQLPKTMNDIGSQIQQKLSQVKTPVNLSDVTKNILDDFSKKTSVFDTTKDFENAQKYIANRLYQGTGNDNPLSGILNAQGVQAIKTGAQTTYANLYKLKGEVAKDLKPVFKAMDNPAANTNFTPKQEANLALWDGLKNEIDKADPEIRALNTDQNNMFTIAKGLVKHATGSSGGSGILGAVVDAMVGGMAGGLPGALAGIALSRTLKSKFGIAGASKFLQSGITKGVTQGIGAASGGMLGNILSQ